MAMYGFGVRKFSKYFKWSNALEWLCTALGWENTQNILNDLMH